MNDKIQWMQDRGFSKDGKIFCVSGGNTFLIKDLLKEQGFKYSTLFGWHSNTEKPVPAPYSLVCLTFDELYLWEPQYKRAFPYTDFKQKIKNKIYINNEKENDSEFIGTIGEREYNLLAIYKKSKYVRKETYGYYIHSFSHLGNKIIWVTKKRLDIEVGQSIMLSGTVAAHSLVGNTKVTKMTRCVIIS